MEVADGAGVVLGIVLERDLDDAVLGLVAVDELVVEDVALLEEDAGYLLLDLGCGYLYHAVSCHDGVANPAEEICYGICHCFDDAN